MRSNCLFFLSIALSIPDPPHITDAAFSFLTASLPVDQAAKKCETPADLKQIILVVHGHRPVLKCTRLTHDYTPHLLNSLLKWSLRIIVYNHTMGVKVSIYLVFWGFN